MGIHRSPDGIVSRPNPVACAVLSSQPLAAGDPLRTADSAAIALAFRRQSKWTLVSVLLAIAPMAILGAVKSRPAMQVPGYRAVPVHYGPMNKMIMSVRINGQPANLLVDTGSNQLILDAEAAGLFGVRPSQRGLRYIRYTRIQGESLPVGFVQNMSAGSMSFGSSLVTLRKSSHPDAANAAFDGVLGLDILFRHKALINCRTKLVFFKVDQTGRINLDSVAGSEKFTRVPIQREETGALTVPCSIRGQPTRLLVDTGAFVTILHEGFVRTLGLAAEPTRVSAQFGRGVSKRISAAKIDDLNIGRFKVPSEKFGVTPLPQFALQQGSSKIAGILGMDTPLQLPRYRRSRWHEPVSEIASSTTEITNIIETGISHGLHLIHHRDHGARGEFCRPQIAQIFRDYKTHFPEESA